VGGILQESSQKKKMILGIKIGVGIVLGVVLLNIAFWGFIILTYMIVTLFECVQKWLSK
jgi:hypothetical protein